METAKRNIIWLDFDLGNQAPKRTITWLDIDLVNQEQRKALKPLSLEERTKRALAKGEELLRQARLAHRLSERN